MDSSVPAPANVDREPVWEDRLYRWLEIAAAAITVFYLADLAAGGDLSEQIRYRYRGWQRRRRDRRDVDRAAAWTVYEAIEILEANQ